MAEHLLDATEIGSAFEQMGGERVPEQVRVDPLRLEPGLLGQPPQHEEHARARKASGATLSSCSMTACLNGMVTLAPPTSGALNRWTAAASSRRGMSSIS